MRNKIKYILIVGMIGLTGVFTTSCSLEPEQSNYKDNEKDPIKNAADMLASLNGSYARMTAASYYGRDIIAFSECRATYMYSTGATGRFDNVSGFTLNPTQAYPKDTWSQIYKVISNTNRILEANVPEDEKVKYYKGQAYIIRALAHYDLVRLYGEQYVGGQGLNALGVPYKTTFKAIDEKIKRSTVGENMKDIFLDLDRGIDLMVKNDLGNNSKQRITLAAAYGLKSRIALFFSKYDTSKLNIVVESAKLAMEKDKSPVMPRSSFLDAYKGDGIMSNSLFELTQSGTDNKGTNSLFNIYVYDPRPETRGGYGDLIWIGSTKEYFFPLSTVNGEPIDDIRSRVVGVLADKQPYRNLGKYTSRTSNIRMLRIEEVMLNYIEATINGATKGDRGLALGYLNQIVGERVEIGGGAYKYSILTFEDYKKERVKELMFEGFAYEDIMRWGGKVTNPVLSTNTDIPSKEVKFGDALTAFPIPQSEINVSKIEQNQAYK
ncbi:MULTISPECIES: RagB/SusD family nutrient uptake outer membrane protein [Myroides]|uniref:RagB/SusD family nutrient uptake outer membrane protein n=1 Tax=Myroides TaxID=76831 RepID=UPI000280A3EF|nr:MULTISPECIES: RagB/SusD family nutrient uptake outer membrane protein [Myroides]APA91231.1 RagB/SusD family nutrient uptake outer membrane protein [Myroides sp. ZB35]EKB02427.1 hypothetical protein HMPREF9711_03212 [Myroides odoratimimus CCUG 3837]EPH08286.1 hypothetical protein HMPREF9713_03238 [Myroides odoratimimus CCUG 12700]